MQFKMLSESEEKGMLRSLDGNMFYEEIVNILKNTRRPLTNEEKNDIITMIVKIAHAEYLTGTSEGKYSK